jgi:hypothetical protein
MYIFPMKNQYNKMELKQKMTNEKTEMKLENLFGIASKPSPEIERLKRLIEKGKVTEKEQTKEQKIVERLFGGYGLPITVVYEGVKHTGTIKPGYFGGIEIVLDESEQEKSSNQYCMH